MWIFGKCLHPDVTLQPGRTASGQRTPAGGTRDLTTFFEVLNALARRAGSRLAQQKLSGP